MEWLYLLLAAAIGYLFGAIPFGWIFVKLTKGMDLREVQSGRTGGTNAMRAAGPVIGGLTAVGDVLKGAAAIWLARAIFGGLLPEPWLPWAEVTVGLFSIVGHNWSIFLQWGGGAGTGPNVGWATAVWPPIFLVAALVVPGLLWLVGMASVASLAMGVLIPAIFAVLYFFTDILSSPAYMVGGILTLLVVAWALRPNIRRILDGTERMVGPAARRLEKSQLEKSHPPVAKKRTKNRLKAQRTEG